MAPRRVATHLTPTSRATAATDDERALYHRRFGPAARGARAALPSEAIHGNAHRDDVIQEALIGVWRARTKHGHPLDPGMVYTAARWAAADAVKSAHMLDLRKRRKPRSVSLDDLTDTGRELGHGRDEARLADLRVDLERELAALHPWERVFLHEWIVEGRSQHEAAERAGVTYAAAQTRWSKTTRPRLARRLAAYRTEPRTV